MHVGEIIDEVVCAGRGDRIFSIVSRPSTAVSTRPVFVFFNVGLIHRAGPSRLHVLLGRKLAAQGFVSVRVDLSGKGDTPKSMVEDYVTSVHEDFADIQEALEQRFGKTQFVFCGLCSGADNAARLAAHNDGVIGMLLLDPFCVPGKRQELWTAVDRYIQPRRYTSKVRVLIDSFRSRDLHASPARRRQLQQDDMDFRVPPTRDELVDSVRAVHELGGSTLAVFSEYTERYYRRRGQFAETTWPAAFKSKSYELLWRDADHIYKSLPLVERLIDTVLAWSDGFDGQAHSLKDIRLVR